MLLKEGSSGDLVVRLQKGLAHLGLLQGAPDGKFGPKTEDAVEAFQTAHDLYADGVFGRGSAAAYNPLVPDECKVDLGAPAGQVLVPSTRLRLVTVPCTVFKGKSGYGSMQLRADVAAKYLPFYEEVKALGGGISSAGSLRALHSGGGSAQSATSLHYPAIAFDLALGTGMQSLADPYLIESLGERRQRVWMRCDGGEERKFQAIIASSPGGVLKIQKQTVTAKVVDFTALAQKHGFYPIRARKAFKPGGSYEAAEWWHFQCEGVLVPGVSTFGSELLKVYPEATIRNSFRGDWDKVRGCVWGEDWN